MSTPDPMVLRKLIPARFMMTKIDFALDNWNGGSCSGAASRTWGDSGGVAGGVSGNICIDTYCWLLLVSPFAKGGFSTGGGADGGPSENISTFAPYCAMLLGTTCGILILWMGSVVV